MDFEELTALRLKAMQNLSEAGKRYGRGKKPDPTLPKIEKVNVMAAFAKMQNVSMTYIYLAMRIKRLGDKFCPELRLFERVQAKEIKLQEAKRKLEYMLACLEVEETERRESE